MTLFFRIFPFVLTRKKSFLKWISKQDFKLGYVIVTQNYYCVFGSCLICCNPVFDDTGLLDLFKAHEMQIKCQNDFPLGQLKLSKEKYLMFHSCSYLHFLIVYQDLLVWWSSIRKIVDPNNVYKYVIWIKKEIKIDDKSVFYDKSIILI